MPGASPAIADTLVRMTKRLRCDAGSTDRCNHRRHSGTDSARRDCAERLVAAGMHGQDLIETGDLKDAADLLAWTNDGKRAVRGVQPLGCSDQHAQGRRVDEAHLGKVDDEVTCAIATRNDARTLENS